VEDDMKRWVMVLGIVASMMAASAARAADTAKFQFWSPSEMKFTAPREGVGRAVAWGNPDKGAFGMIVRFTAGTDRGWHSHSHPVHLVVISGTLVFEGEGISPRELGPGDGVTEPAKTKHDSRCKDGADCTFLITGTHKYDLIPAKAATASK
jgi:quercetin dioxygenase-like cupin family protein